MVEEDVKRKMEFSVLAMVALRLSGKLSIIRVYTISIKGKVATLNVVQVFLAYELL